MAGGINLTDAFSRYIDEKFYPQTQAGLALDKSFEFKGDRTVKIMSFPNPPLNDYHRSGSNRYGTPDDLSRNIQVESVTQDKAFTYVIDKGDYVQSEMLMNIGRSIDNQMRGVVMPEFDRYVFKKWAAVAKENGGYASSSITKSNAFSMFLNGVQYLKNHNVPSKDTYAFCSFSFVNLLMQDSSFIRSSDLSQEMVMRGVVGTCDGITIVEVSADLLPAGAAFILVHKTASVAPVQLEEAKYNEDPPGVSGFLVEGRILFDCFVFNSKCNSIYFHGGQSVLKPLNIETAASAANKSTIIIHGTKEASTNKWYYITAANHAGLPTVTYGTALTPGTASTDWANAVELTSTSTQITPASGHTRVLVVETDSSYYPLAVSEALLNIGA